MPELLRYVSIGQGRVSLAWKRRFAAGAGKVPRVEFGQIVLTETVRRAN